MSVPVFNQVNNDVNLYVISTLSEATINGYWFGYAALPESNLGTSISTEKVWHDIGGYYLFLKETPTNWTDFQNSLNKLRSNLGPPNLLRCLWIENPNDSTTLWKLNTLFAKASVNGTDISWITQRTTGFSIGEYEFSVLGVSTLTYRDDASGGGFEFSRTGSFSGPNGGYSIESIYITFSGSNLGVFNGTITADMPTNSLQNDVWQKLNIGLQYASAPENTTESSFVVLEGLEDPKSRYLNAVKILHMPIFDRQTTAINFDISFDPLHTMMATRTALRFSSSQLMSTNSFNTFLRTTRGYPIKMKPLAANGVISDACFVFGNCPTNISEQNVNRRYHLCPDGAFKMEVITPEITATETEILLESYQLLLGLSGLEYVTLTGKDTDMMVFSGGNPAFIPAVDPDSSEAANVTQALTAEATTSHGTVMALSTADNPNYYAQPKEAPIYSGKNQRADNILDFNAMKAFTLSSNTQNQPKVFPIGIYSGLTDALSLLAKKMENASLAPYRHYKLGEAYGVQSLVAKNINTTPRKRVRATDDPLGVTPQGLVSELTPDYQDFDGLYIGNMPGTNYPKVDLTLVEGKFKESLQSNQLFFVASNVEVFMQGTSVRYQLTSEDTPYLKALGVTDEVITAALQAVSTSTQPFETEVDFTDVISPVMSEEDVKKYLKICGILKVEMDGWTFQLSPRSWRTNSESPTLMIAKFCNRTLLEMANDSSSWSWPEVATPSNGGTIASTQKSLLDVLLPTSYEDAGESYKIFFETVVNDPSWNGFLFLNAPVDISELPDDLKFLSAGIDLTQFYAHHIGFSQTPFQVTGGVPTLEQTAAFGLIDYTDTEDFYAEETIPFGFKTMKLNARFANAALADFSAQVELMLNQLLAASLFKNVASRGNNLIINGTYQRVGGTPSYAFALTGENVFNTSDTALTEIEILSVQLISSPSETDEVLTTFILMGNLRFFIIEEFDMFSYGNQSDGTDGYLRFNNFAIDMIFSLATPNVQTFVAREEAVNFDMSNSSEPRPESLLNNFPLIVSTLVASPNLSAAGEEPKGQTPEEMGYTSVSAPIDQTPMKPSWYGLQYVLDMGTLGALTGSNSIKINILVAWSKGAEQGDPPIYIGLKLPNIPALGGSFPLQGVLKLGFRNFQFITYRTDEGKLGYNLKLRQFALSVLVWSFPPGNNEIVLFGEPGNPKGSLGWYAAYAADEEESATAESKALMASDELKVAKKPQLSRVEKRLKSGRRTPPIN